MKSLSRVRLFATPWTVAYQAPPSMGFSRQECWSGLPFPSPGDFPDPGIEPGSPALWADSLLWEPSGKLIKNMFGEGGTSYSWLTLAPGGNWFLFRPYQGFPGVSDGKAGDPGSIPGSGSSPGEGNGNPLQHSCLENPMDGGA